MGQFTVRTRYGGMDLQGTTGLMSGETGEFIHSWRTGTSLGDVQGESAGFTAGIRRPSQKGDLGDIIRDRKRFTEDIMSTIGSPAYNPNVGGTIGSVTDNGHPFTSVKFRSVAKARIEARNRYTGELISTTPVYAEHSAVTAGRFGAFGTFPTTLVTSGFPSSSSIIGRTSASFQSMRPGGEIAKIGETVVSLVRGDFPTILRNLLKTKKSFASWRASYNPSDLKLARGVSKDAGSEYLNQVFGWQPLISDFENAIRVLMVIDRMIYGDSIRRHREVAFNSWETTRSGSPIVRTAYNRVGSGQLSGAITSNALEQKRWHSFDIRISARLVPIARPGIGANSFVDQAADKLEQLGLWYPTLGWDLLPYSWLVDWFTNLGTALNNAMVFGKTNMVNIDYAWATECLRVLSTTTLDPRVGRISGTTTYRGDGTARVLSVSKRRIRATPWGFGTDLSSLSASQASILTALGAVKLL